MPDLSTEANLPSYSGTQTFGDGNDQPSYDSNANLPTYTAPSDDSYGTPAEESYAAPTSVEKSYSSPADTSYFPSSSREVSSRRGQSVRTKGGGTDTDH